MTFVVHSVSDMSSKIQTPSNVSELPLALVKSMIGLATSGFGVVVALAWNQVIQKAVADYIDPYLGKNSGMISLFIYAMVMTALAVIVTMQLTQLQRGLEFVQERVNARRAQQSEEDETSTPKNTRTATKPSERRQKS